MDVLDWVRVILPTVLALVLGWVGGALSKHRQKRTEAIKRLEDKQDANNRGTCCLIRKAIIDGYDQFVKHNAPMSVERREEYTELYNAYKALGGNGVIEHLYEQLHSLPTHIVNQQEERHED